MCSSIPPPEEMLVLLFLLLPPPALQRQTRQNVNPEESKRLEKRSCGEKGRERQKKYREPVDWELWDLKEIFMRELTIITLFALHCEKGFPLIGNVRWAYLTKFTKEEHYWRKLSIIQQIRDFSTKHHQGHAFLHAAGVAIASRHCSCWRVADAKYLQVLCMALSGAGLSLWLAFLPSISAHVFEDIPKSCKLLLKELIYKLYTEPVWRGWGGHWE